MMVKIGDRWTTDKREEAEARKAFLNGILGLAFIAAIIIILVWAFRQPGHVKVMLPWHASAYMD